MPHTVAIQVRTVTSDGYGGVVESWSTVSGKSTVEAWVQNAGDGEISQFAKRGIRVTKKIYFPVDQGITERHRIVYGSTIFTVRSYSEADVGHGILYRAMVDDDSTSEAVA